MVCLVTENWLASDECFGEFRAAWYMGKRIIPLFALRRSRASSAEKSAREGPRRGSGPRPRALPEAGQRSISRRPDVASRLEAGLRAAGALATIGLDPEAFEIDRNLRPTPFPGLASFGDDDADAALFYGRSREIAESLEELRKMRAEADLRPFVVLGASGAGKSSLLKAGIIPRLRREAPAWLPLRAFRPGADPLLNFAEALARTLADFGKVEAHGIIRDRLFDAWSKAERRQGGLTPAGRHAAAALEAEGRRLRDAAGRAGATILISIDQAEEIARADGESGDALADYLRAALASRDELATRLHHPHRQLPGAAKPSPLPGPGGARLRSARHPGVSLRQRGRGAGEALRRAVDHALVDALMEDAPKEDALPLLAFALQRLWRQYAASGALTLDNYDKVGGLQGLIEDAAERALRGLAPDEDVPLPSGPPRNAGSISRLRPSCRRSPRSTIRARPSGASPTGTVSTTSSRTC